MSLLQGYMMNNTGAYVCEGFIQFGGQIKAKLLLSYPAFSECIHRTLIQFNCTANSVTRYLSLCVPLPFQTKP